MSRCPFQSGRRDVLRGLAVAGSALGGVGVARAEALMQSPAGRDAMAAAQVIGFHGRHQPGILNPPPAAGLVAAFDVLAGSRQDLARLFRLLTERVEFLMQGGRPPMLDPRFPPADSGIVGPEVLPDATTLTVAVGASLFDARFGLEALKPRQLVPMGRFPNDAPERGWMHGDLLVQICANTPASTLHALRDVIRATPGLLRLRWKLEGFLPPAASGAGEPTRETPRNLLGFKDGTANLDPTDTGLMARRIFAGPAQGEPGWAAGGSYQVVRIIRNLVERWDRTPLREQERIMGRQKDSGAPLGGGREDDVPDYAADPDGSVTPLDAHIRLANPRRAETEASRILRRPFNYSRGVTASGQLDMGLLFICFQADLEAGFIAIQRRLDGEPLEEYIKPVGGGYYFALPGVPQPGAYLAQGLVES